MEKFRHISGCVLLLKPVCVHLIDCGINLVVVNMVLY